MNVPYFGENSSSYKEIHIIGYIALFFVTFGFCVSTGLLYYTVDTLNVVSLLFFILILGLFFYVCTCVYTMMRYNTMMTSVQILVVFLLFIFLNFFYLGYLLERYTNIATLIQDRIFTSTQYSILLIWTIIGFLVIPFVFILYTIFVISFQENDDATSKRAIGQLEHQISQLRKMLEEKQSIPLTTEYVATQETSQQLQQRPPILSSSPSSSIPIVNVYPSTTLHPVEVDNPIFNEYPNLITVDYNALNPFNEPATLEQKK